MKHQDFRYRQFLPTIILQCVRWYLRYPLSYLNLEEIIEERGEDVNHTTLYRWVQKYSQFTPLPRSCNPALLSLYDQYH